MKKRKGREIVSGETKKALSFVGRLAWPERTKWHQNDDKIEAKSSKEAAYTALILRRGNQSTTLAILYPYEH
jgi:hypothetical protein